MISRRIKSSRKDYGFSMGKGQNHSSVFRAARQAKGRIVWGALEAPGHARDRPIDQQPEAKADARLPER